MFKYSFTNALRLAEDSQNLTPEERLQRTLAREEADDYFHRLARARNDAVYPPTDNETEEERER
eukprot:6165795-Amphidinium_carterae.1